LFFSLSLFLFSGKESDKRLFWRIPRGGTRFKYKTRTYYRRNSLSNSSPRYIHTHTHTSQYEKNKVISERPNISFLSIKKDLKKYKGTVSLSFLFLCPFLHGKKVPLRSLKESMMTMAAPSLAKAIASLSPSLLLRLSHLLSLTLLQARCLREEKVAMGSSKRPRLSQQRRKRGLSSPWYREGLP